MMELIPAVISLLAIAVGCAMAMSYPRQRNSKPQKHIEIRDLKVAPRESTPTCPYCWDEVEDGRVCNQCGARAHKGCIKDMGKSKKCPTVGCAGKLKKKIG